MSACGTSLLAMPAGEIAVALAIGIPSLVVAVLAPWVGCLTHRTPRQQGSQHGYRLTLAVYQPRRAPRPARPSARQTEVPGLPPGMSPGLIRTLQLACTRPSQRPPSAVPIPAGSLF